MAAAVAVVVLLIRYAAAMQTKHLTVLSVIYSTDCWLNVTILCKLNKENLQ
jgi:hypothetical protein